MDIKTVVKNGITFIKLDGVFDNKAFKKFNDEIDYLLYNQGISLYAISFNVAKIDDSLISKIQNKLVEIFLSCGEVVMCGLNKIYQKKIGSRENKLYYVDNIAAAFKLLNI